MFKMVSQNFTQNIPLHQMPKQYLTEDMGGISDDEGNPEQFSQSAKLSPLSEMMNEDSRPAVITANFDCVMQMEEDHENFHFPSDTVINDEVEKLLVHLCQVVESVIPVNPTDHCSENIKLLGKKNLNDIPDIVPEKVCLNEENLQPLAVHCFSNTLHEEAPFSHLMISGSLPIDKKTAFEWGSENKLLKDSIEIKNTIIEEHEKKSKSLEANIKELVNKVTISNDLLSAKNSEIQSLKNQLENKAMELNSMHSNISESLKKICELQHRLERQQSEIKLIKKEKVEAMEEIAELHEELKEQKIKYKDLEKVFDLNASELDELRYEKANYNVEVQSKRSKLISEAEDDTLGSVSFSGLNCAFPQMNVTGPFYKCDIAENQKQSFPNHHQSFNFYNESNINNSDRKRSNKENNSDAYKKKEKPSSSSTGQKSTPFLRVGLSRKSKIRRPLHETN